MTAPAGIVLAGGRSTRMGRPKATLPWRGATLLEHVVGVLAEAGAEPIVVVRAPGQALPALPPGARVAEDAVAGRGPLQGLAAGLEAVAATAPVAFAAAVDLPWLQASLVRAIVAGLDDRHEVAVPVVAGRRQPLAAAYRTALAPLAAELAAGERRALRGLLERCRARELDERALPAGAAAMLRDADTPADLAGR